MKTKYKLITAESDKDFNDCINDLSEKGWVPHGNHTVMKDEYGDIIFTQMMKLETNTPT